jgi:signal transduction histidine kinase/CheY-like chemotaxis protein
MVGLRIHHEVVDKQIEIHALYAKLSNKLALVNSISTLSERFDDWTQVEDQESLVPDFKKLLAELRLDNESFSYWLSQNHFGNNDSRIGKLIKAINLERKMQEYLERAEELVDDEDLSFEEVKKNVRYLSKSSRNSLRQAFHVVSEVIVDEQSKSLSRLNRMGIILFGLFLLQVIFVWLLVFKPLYTTITNQHHKLTDAFLKAKSASRSKNEFLANISHEIRTPMTAILGYADQLKKNALSGEDKDEAISIVNRNATHLMSLVDEILDISKIEAGKFDFVNEEIDLTTFLNEFFSLINVQAIRKGIDLVFKHRGEIPAKIYSDPKRLKQILFNVIGNAIKFTEKGFIELIVSYDQENNYLKMQVRDTGVGISKKNLKKIFRPFEQADSSVSRTYGGTGLGLVLSKGLAKGMGGDISVIDSTLGVGTTFEISISAGSVADKKLISSFSTNVTVNQEDESVGSVTLHGRKILVVDDAKENARLFQMYLNDAGAEVEVANEGQTAIDLALNKPYDLVLLDLQMPGKDGYQVIRELRDGAYLKPIVALTAHAMAEEREKTKSAGFNDHITKPVEPQFLVSSISRLIDEDSLRNS